MRYKPINDLVEKICVSCQRKFVVKATQALLKRKFCSIKCANSYNLNGKKNTGRKHTQKWRRWAKKRFSGENNPFYGKTHTKESIKKLSSSLTGRRLSESHKQKLSSIFSGTGNPFYGKTHSEEVKNKIRENANSPNEKLRRREWAISMAKRRMGAKFAPLYNPKACDLFDMINKEMGWDGQHARHNGEKQVLGWFLDYYEPTQNIAIEFDERWHNQKSKKERDERKQKEVIEELKCRFFRIKENERKLWKTILTS